MSKRSEPGRGRGKAREGGSSGGSLVPASSGSALRGCHAAMSQLHGRSLTCRETEEGGERPQPRPAARPLAGRDPSAHRALASPAPRQHAAPAPRAGRLLCFQGAPVVPLISRLHCSLTRGILRAGLRPRLCALGMPLLLHHILLEKVQLHRLHSDGSR